jgi:hypothetical protein
VLASLIERGARPRHLALAAAVYAPLALLMFGWPGLVARVSRACGRSPFDVGGYWDAGDARRMLEACGDTGRAAYVQLEIADLAYPAALAALLLIACALLLRRFGGRSWPVLLPILAMTVLDYLENAGVWFVLLRWPDAGGSVADAAGVATALKRAFGFIAFSVPLVLGALELVHRAHRRGRS